MSNTNYDFHNDRVLDRQEDKFYGKKIQKVKSEVEGKRRPPKNFKKVYEEHLDEWDEFEEVLRK